MCPHCEGIFAGHCSECGVARAVDAKRCATCGYPFSRDMPADSDGGPQADIESQQEPPSRESSPAVLESSAPSSLAREFWVNLILIGHIGFSALLGVLFILQAYLVVFISPCIIYWLTVFWRKTWAASGWYTGQGIWRVLARVYIAVDVLIIYIIVQVLIYAGSNGDLPQEFTDPIFGLLVLFVWWLVWRSRRLSPGRSEIEQAIQRSKEFMDRRSRKSFRAQ